MNREDQFIPHLIVNDGMAALKFYKEVFGAEEGHQHHDVTKYHRQQASHREL